MSHLVRGISFLLSRLTLQPGYTVYRHLQCAVFGEHIMCAEDVDGCSDLESEDYERLAERVKESVIEIEKEKEELEPDELVPVKFEGEMRSAPKGFVGNLLPFQVEGSSWMYHQEIKEPELKGGILADEQGMRVPDSVYIYFSFSHSTLFLAVSVFR